MFFVLFSDKCQPLFYQPFFTVVIFPSEFFGRAFLPPRKNLLVEYINVILLFPLIFEFKTNRQWTNLKGSFEVSSLYKGLNFVKNYTKDASSSPTETIIELRSCNILGGSSYGLAIWKDPSLVGAFLLKAHVVKKLILFMKEAGCEKVSFYSWLR